jgi:hypothetical protein
VTLTPSEVPNSGGHSHTGRPLNTYYASPTGYTNTNGTFQTTYTASYFGGQERITASVQGVEGSATLNVAVQGLVLLGPGANYTLTGSTTYHAANHYGTAGANSGLVAIANQYGGQFPGSGLLYNDQSLPQGGLFDIGPPYGNLWSMPHIEHRIGINCDVSKSNVSQDRWAILEQIFRDNGSSNFEDEGNHWHLRFQ